MVFSFPTHHLAPSSLGTNTVEEVIHPCNPNPCPSNHICQVNRKGCLDELNCQPYLCVPGKSNYSPFLQLHIIHIQEAEVCFYVFRLQNGWSLWVLGATGCSYPSAYPHWSYGLLRGVQLWSQWAPGELCGDALHGHQQALHRRRTEEE